MKPSCAPMTVWLLALDTLCQGLTVAYGDIYLTEAEAEAELLDLQANVEECDHFVMKGLRHAEGRVTDEFGRDIHVEGDE